MNIKIPTRNHPFLKDMSNGLSYNSKRMAYKILWTNISFYGTHYIMLYIHTYTHSTFFHISNEIWHFCVFHRKRKTQRKFSKGYEFYTLVSMFENSATEIGSLFDPQKLKKLKDMTIFLFYSDIHSSNNPQLTPLTVLKSNIKAQIL